MTEHNPADSSHDSLVESHEFNASNVSCATHTVVHELVSSHSEGRELHHDFNLVILLTFSFASIWCAGKAASKLGLPTLVGEILVGVVLGPPLADLMPVPEALMLFGEVGLMLLVLEAGLDVDFAMLKLIGLRGIAIAVTGSLTPLVLGWLLSSFFLGLEWKARGTAQRTPRRSPALLPRARAGGVHTPCRHPAHALHTRVRRRRSRWAARSRPPRWGSRSTCSSRPRCSTRPPASSSSPPPCSTTSSRCSSSRSCRRSPTRLGLGLGLGLG